MGDARSIVLTIPSPDAWVIEPYVTWTIYDEKDRQLAQGVVDPGRYVTLLDHLQTAVAIARRHLRGAYR